jgi:Zn-finger nucleic acid-binding protein
LTYLKVTIDRCPECQGVWLDHGEGRAILAAEAKSGKGFFTDFIRGVTGGKKEESPL